jgi:hypothetical protein
LQAPKFANERIDGNLVTGRIGAWKRGLGTLSELIDRLDESIGRGDLPGALRSQLTSLREQTEAAETGFQELEPRIKEIEARIKERERIRRFSPESKANSRKRRSLKQIVGLWRRRSE